MLNGLTCIKIKTNEATITKMYLHESMIKTILFTILQDQGTKSMQTGSENIEMIFAQIWPSGSVKYNRYGVKLHP